MNWELAVLIIIAVEGLLVLLLLDHSNFLTRRIYEILRKRP